MAVNRRNKGTTGDGDRALKIITVAGTRSKLRIVRVKIWIIRDWYPDCGLVGYAFWDRKM